MNGLRRFFMLTLFYSSLSQTSDNISVSSEHVLEYMYTYYNSSYYEVIGLLDGEPVDVSRNGSRPIPKKGWNEAKKSFNYTLWNAGILDRVRMKIDTNFLRLAESLKNIMEEKQSDGHIVQMRIGCKEFNTLRAGFVEFGYKAQDIMYLDFHEQQPVWRQSEEDATFVAEQWNKIEPIKNNFADFVHNTCDDSLYNFIWSETNNVSSQYSQTVYRIPTGSLMPGKQNLSLLVTGFYPNSYFPEITWYRNNVRLEGRNWTFGPRPNENHTYQLKTTMEISASVGDKYICEVRQEKVLIRPKKETWVVENLEISSDRNIVFIILVTIVFAIAIVFALIVVLKIVKICLGANQNGQKQSRASSISTEVSGVTAVLMEDK